MLTSAINMFHDYEDLDINIIMGGNTGYYSSLFTTLLISINRYIAIRYSLTYSIIATKARWIYLVTGSWILSALAATLPYIETARFGQKIRYRRLSVGIILCGITVAISILLGLLSLSIIKIRKDHLQQMKGREKHFGVPSRDVSALHTLKQSVKDVIQLNLITVIQVMLVIIIDTYSIYFSPKSGHMIKRALYGTYFITNPILYATMSGLRRQYHQILRCNKRNSVTRNTTSRGVISSTMCSKQDSIM